MGISEIQLKLLHDNKYYSEEYMSTRIYTNLYLVMVYNGIEDFTFENSDREAVWEEVHEYFYGVSNDTC